MQNKSIAIMQTWLKVASIITIFKKMPARENNAD